MPSHARAVWRCPESWATRPPHSLHRFSRSFSRAVSARRVGCRGRRAAGRLPRRSLDGPLVMPRRTDIKKIMLLGSGPIVIGQAC